ncbi:hypothetical protein C2845_PM12G31630 [Panicum miliaceum]|uniref:DUF6817 domain-containing protein n=1 Tax=Panicum miliaceum TaxID=4540 RepID=A0A3L6QGJ8_PANMI|nr:hypothetical protein C2845_PM12G31630 [Panicum miliaceum]
MSTQQGFCPSSLKTHGKDLPSLLADAQPFLRDELDKIDPELPSFLSILRSAGAGERHHKNGAFLAHLLNFHRIIQLWGGALDITRCGLFHSSYANSYVNISIFESTTTREDVQQLIGAPVERLVFLFCAVPRHKLIHEELHFQYTDAELANHLAASDMSIKTARETGTFDTPSVSLEPDDDDGGNSELTTLTNVVVNRRCIIIGFGGSGPFWFLPALSTRPTRVTNRTSNQLAAHNNMGRLSS